MLNYVTINLNKNFRPFGGYIPEYWDFPSGELGVKVNDIPISDNVVRIVARLNSSEEIIRLFMLTDAIRRQQPNKISLFISYLPYARQDRVCVKGESLSLNVMADLLNIQGYSEIAVLDAHSKVSGDLINNFVGVSNHKFVKHVVLPWTDNYVLTAPDMGASKKIYELAKAIGYTREIITATKRRDLTNGKILGIDVEGGDVNGKHCVIIDDICSRGGTFIGLAARLKELGASKVSLIVTHYEGTADIKKLKTSIDAIYTTNSFSENQDVSNFLYQFELFEKLL